jgi:hypothetical protein
LFALLVHFWIITKVKAIAPTRLASIKNAALQIVEIIAMATKEKRLVILLTVSLSKNHSEQLKNT